MTYAPDYDVPENASPYKHLPILSRCVECRTPLAAFEEHTAVREGRAVAGLCADCATRPIPPAETVEHDEGCCMNGVPATAGPHPDCPGVRALEARPTPPEGAKP